MSYFKALLDDALSREPLHIRDSGLDITLQNRAMAAVDHAIDLAVNAPELIELWSCAGESWWNEDASFGQWGLHLLSPPAVRDRTIEERSRRPDDFRPTDLVIGEFLGDSDLLVLDAAEVDSKRLRVCLPLDDRNDWFAVGPSLDQFLTNYLDRPDRKFWT